MNLALFSFNAMFDYQEREGKRDVSIIPLPFIRNINIIIDYTKYKNK